MTKLEQWIDEHHVVSRGLLCWIVWLVTLVTLRVTSPEVIPTVNAAVATVVTAVIGILYFIGKWYVAKNWRDIDIDRLD